VVSVLHATVLANLTPLNVFKALYASDPGSCIAGGADMEYRLDVLKETHGVCEVGKSTFVPWKLDVASKKGKILPIYTSP
jgi:hypothetical protein